MKLNYITLLFLLSAPVTSTAQAIDFFQPPTIFTKSPEKTFKHQKSWFYYSKNSNSYIFQAYLPDFDKDDVVFKLSKRLVDGLQIYVSASKWKTVNSKYLPTKTLLTFSQTINLPSASYDDIKSRFEDNVLTLTLPVLDAN
jgi:HSP20 family molecular chaperone IbpA